MIKQSKEFGSKQIILILFVLLETDTMFMMLMAKLRQALSSLLMKLYTMPLLIVTIGKQALMLLVILSLVILVQQDS